MSRIGLPSLQHFRRPSSYTLVTVDCFAGRSVDAKRALYRAIVSGLGTFGIPADHVTIVVRDIDTTSWGLSLIHI